MSALYDLIDEVAETNPSLAKAIANEVKIYTDRRPFGLNFERHTPESVRLYGRRARKGDLVNILPPRGSFEKAGNKVAWRVTAINGDTASLTRQVNDERLTESASISDLVVLSEFDKPIFPGLKKTGEIQRGGNKPYQVVINGENYHALKALLYPYEGKVDCIYIDPPYNTGAHDWKYNNDYVDSNDAYQHSKWLAMMECRLKLAKRLLNPKDSVLIVTIDEKEYLRLGLLLEQTFPGARIQMISSLINPSGAARGSQFYRTDEYLYIIEIGGASPESLPLGPEWITSKKKDTLPKLQWRTLRRRGSHDLRTEREHSFFPMYLSSDGKKIIGPGEELPLSVDRGTVVAPEGQMIVWPLKPDGTEGCWQVGAKTIRTLMEKGYIRIGDKNQWGPVLSYLASGEQRKVEAGIYPVIGHAADGSIITESPNEEKKFVPGTQWRIRSHNAREYGSSLLNALMPDRRFPFPKSLYAVEDTLRFFVANKPDALILDFFAGSGTTAHAVMRLNHQDGGRRRCICITNNEVSEDEAKKLTTSSYRQGDSDWEQYGICEYITKPRITAAITGKTPHGTPIKGNYKFTDEFPMSDGFEENAVFYDLTYEDEINVELDHAFSAIAPLLWLRSGSEGRCITERQKDYDIADTYAVLFDYRYSRQFIQELKRHDTNVRLACIVTDQDSRYQDVARQLPDGVEPLRLYESYLRSFKINQGED